MNSIKWVGSVFIAILLVGTGIGVVMLLASISTFIFMGVGILGGIWLIAHGVKTMMDRK